MLQQRETAAASPDGNQMGAPRCCTYGQHLQADWFQLTCTSVPSLRVIVVQSWALSTMAAADNAESSSSHNAD